MQSSSSFKQSGPPAADLSSDAEGYPLSSDLEIVEYRALTKPPRRNEAVKTPVSPVFRSAHHLYEPPQDITGPDGVCS